MHSTCEVIVDKAQQAGRWKRGEQKDNSSVESVSLEPRRPRRALLFQQAQTHQLHFALRWCGGRKRLFKKRARHDYFRRLSARD